MGVRSLSLDARREGCERVGGRPLVARGRLLNWRKDRAKGVSRGMRDCDGIVDAFGCKLDLFLQTTMSGSASRSSAAYLVIIRPTVTLETIVAPTLGELIVLLLMLHPHPLPLILFTEAVVRLGLGSREAVIRRLALSSGGGRPKRRRDQIEERAD